MIGKPIKKRGIIKVNDPERVQAFNHHRDGQGILHFALYDSRSGLVFTEAARQDRGGDYIPPGTISKDIINFLQNRWETYGITPDVLVMDAAKIRAELVTFMADKGVRLQLLSQEQMSNCQPLETAFQLRRIAGETPAPPRKS